MRPLLTLALVLPALAGCLSSDDRPGEGGPAPGFVQGLAANLPPFAWDAGAGLDWWEGFATTYVKRDAFLPNNQLATDHIAQGLRDLGMDVQVLEYPAGTLLGPSLPAAAGPLKVHVVVGTRNGTSDPGHALALGGHYDTQSATVQGAYDNAAGTAMVYNVCKALLQVHMKRTLLCLFFDAEELGLLGSSAYVADPPAGSPVIDFYFGYDMTGMNWPGYPEWKLYNFVGAEFEDPLFPFVESTLRTVLAWPAEGAEALPLNDRNSDEVNFISAHVPTVRFAGGRNAADYDQYHLPGDTVDHVYEVVGGRGNFEAGFGAIVEESYTLALMLDQTSLEEMANRL